MTQEHVTHLFPDRATAGRLLAQQLGKYANTDATPTVVAAISRAGLEIAQQVATALDAPLVSIPLREVTVVERAEGGMDRPKVAAICAPGGTVVYDSRVMTDAALSREDIKPAVLNASFAVDHLEKQHPPHAPMPADIDFTGGLEVLVVDDVPHHKYGWFDPNSMLSVWYGGDRAPTMHQGVFHGRGLRERLYTDKTVDISEDDEEFSVEMTRLTEADVDNFVLRYTTALAAIQQKPQRMLGLPTSMDVHVQRMVVVTPAIPEQLLDRLHKLGDVWSEAGSPQLASATTPVTLTPGISTARTAPTVEWVRVRQAEPSGTVFTRSFGPTPDYSPAELETAARAMTVEETPLDLGRPDVVESMFVVSAAFSESGAGMRWYDRSCSGDGPTREGESCSENIQ